MPVGPLLFIAAEDDVGAEGAAALEELSRNQGDLQIVPGGDHGTDLLEGAAADEVWTLLDGFLAENLPLTRPCPRPPEVGTFRRPPDPSPRRGSPSQSRMSLVGSFFKPGTTFQGNFSISGSNRPPKSLTSTGLSHGNLSSSLSS